MARRDLDLPEDDLSRLLRRELRAARAPEPWTDRALAVSAQAMLPRRESRLRLVLPHLAGLALLVGMVVAITLRPDAWNALSAFFAGAKFTGGPVRLPHVSPDMILAWMSTPLLIFLLYQGSRGFPILHRRWPWR